MANGTTTAAQFSLSSEQMDRLFPFYILLDENLRIAAHGSMLATLIDIRNGALLDDLFHIHTRNIGLLPFPALAGESYQILYKITSDDDSNIMLQGEMEYLADSRQLLLLGIPGMGKQKAEVANARKDYRALMAVQANENNALPLSKTARRMKEDTIKGVAITDANGAIQWVSREFERSVGVTLEEVKGMRPRDVVYGKESTHIPRSYVDEMVQKKQPFSFDNIGYNRKNKSFWFRTTVQPVLDADGEVKGRYYIFEDVTELKNNEYAARESQELWKFALEGAGDGVWSYQPAENELNVSFKFKELLGFEKADTFDRGKLDEVAQPGDQRVVGEALRQLTRESPSFSTELLLKTKQGSYRYYKMRGKATEWDGADKPTVILGTLTDINDEKTKDLELKKAASRITAILKSVNYGLLLENEKREIVLINEPFCKLFHIPMKADELVGMDCRLLAGESKAMFQDPETFEQGVQRLLDTRLAVTDEILYLADGRILERDYIPIEIDGVYSGHLWRYNDISYRKRLELKLLNSEAQLTSLINNFGASVLFEDTNRIIRFCNSSFLRMVGMDERDADNLIGLRTTDELRGVRELFETPDETVRWIEKCVHQGVKDQAVIKLVNGRILSGHFVPVVAEGTTNGYLWLYEDITDVYNYERKLIEQREYYHRILDELPADIIVFDLEHKFRLINKSAVADADMRQWMMGRTLKEYSERRQVDAELTRARTDVFHKALQTWTEQKLLEHFDLPDGSEKYMLRFIYPFSATASQDAFVVVCGIDITDQVRSEHEVIRQREYYHSILNEIPADIAVFTPDHKYSFINRNGIANPEIRQWLIGKDDYDYCRLRNVNTAMADERRERFREALQTKRPVSMVTEGRGADGGVSYILRIFHPHTGEDGEVTQVIGYGMDITNEVAMKRKAELHEQWLMQLLNIVKSGILSCGSNGEIVYMNHACRQILGLGEAVVPTNIFTLADGEERRKITELMDRVQQRDQPQSCVLNIGEEGHKKVLDLTVVKQADGAQVNYVASLVEITELVNKERNLKRILEKEKELSLSKSEFIRITSHELRTPLAIIQANAELMQVAAMLPPGKAGKLNPTVLTDRVIKEVKVMTELLNELMMLGRMELGKIDFKPEPAVVQKVINEIVYDQYRPHTDGRILVVDMPDNDLVLNLDKKLMRHAIVNLITNAFKYSQGRPAPELTVTHDEGMVRISIKDHGIGIPEQDKAKLFNSFTRASNVGNIHGSGLGLMIVEYAISRHGGKITFESKESEGSVFTIQLPKG